MSETNPTTPLSTSSSDTTRSRVDMEVDTHSGLSTKDALVTLENEISVLMIKIATAGNKLRAEVDPWRNLLKKKRIDYQNLKEMSDLMSPAASIGSQAFPSVAVAGNLNVVPHDLPVFQWPGIVRDKSREVYADIDECLRQFEDVLKSHGLDYDDNWSRLLPRCLSHDLRDWLNEFLKAAGKDVSWWTLKGAMSARYGTPKEQLRFGSIREFLACTKGEQETLDAFMGRFKRLRAKSGVTDKYVVAMVFFDAFSEATARRIMMTMAQAEESCFYDIDYVSAIARRVDIANRDKVGHTVASAGARKRISEIPVSAEAKKSKFAKELSVSLGDNGDKQTPWVSKFGKTLKQHIAERSCKDCNQHYGKGHECNTAIRTPTKVLRSMTKRPANREIDAMVAAARASEEADRVFLGRKVATSVSVPVPVAVATNDSLETNAGVNASADSDIVMLESGGDSTDDESDLRERAQSTLVNSLAKVSVTDDELMINLSAQQCKFDTVFSAPPAMQSNSICVLLLVQNVVCYGLVDTGATFSSSLDH